MNLTEQKKWLTDFIADWEALEDNEELSERDKRGEFTKLRNKYSHFLKAEGLDENDLSAEELLVQLPSEHDIDAESVKEQYKGYLLVTNNDDGSLGTLIYKDDILVGGTYSYNDDHIPSVQWAKQNIDSGKFYKS